MRWRLLCVDVRRLDRGAEPPPGIGLGAWNGEANSSLSRMPETLPKQLRACMATGLAGASSTLLAATPSSSASLRA